MKTLAALLLIVMCLAAAPQTRPAAPISIAALVRRIPPKLWRDDGRQLTPLQKDDLDHWFSTQAGTSIRDTMVLTEDPEPNRREDAIELTGGTTDLRRIKCFLSKKDKEGITAAHKGDSARFTGSLRSVEVQMLNDGNQVQYRFWFTIGAARLTR